MRLCRALGAGETPSADEQIDGLTALNAMIAEWAINDLYVYSVSEEVVTWAANQTSRTIGATGTFAVERPNELQRAFQRSGTVDYPIYVIGDTEYSAISDKSATGTIITHIYYDPTYPDGTLYAYPVPSVAATVHLGYLKSLQAFETATEALALPPGYEVAIAFNLAIELAPEYGLSIPPEVARRASSSLRNLRKQNRRAPIMSSEVGHFGRSHSFNINRGY